MFGKLERRQATHRLVQLQPQARAALSSLAGFRGVGVGIRERAGILTGELVFRVYVDTKRPETALQPWDVVPKQVLGIDTDVIELGRARRACWDKGTRPVIGGIEIASSPFAAMANEPGTLTCLVTTSDGKTAVLTNEHVLQTKINPDLRVFQPHFDRCLGFECNKIGTSEKGFMDHQDVDGTPFWVDAAYAIVDSDVGTKNVIRKVTNPSGPDLVEVPVPPGADGTVKTNHGKVVVIRNSNDAMVDTTRIADEGEAQPGTLVWKVGRTSHLTVGIVEDIMAPVDDDHDHTRFENCLLIKGLAGYMIDGDPAFGDFGDSGSAVMDLENKIVGIYTGHFSRNDPVHPTTAPRLRSTYVCHIAAVKKALGVTVNKSPLPIVPSSGVVELAEPEHVDFGERLHALEARVRRTSSGPAVLAILEKHGREIYDLVLHRRAVTVAWHRHRGPSFAARLARTIREGTDSLPHEIDGVTLLSLANAMAVALEAQGSVALRDSIASNAPWLRSAIENATTMNELLARLDRIAS